MKKTIFSTFLLLGASSIKAQLSPVITSWLQNNTTTGTYYVNGNSTAQSNGILVNCQQVQYSSGSVYVSTTGIPALLDHAYSDKALPIGEGQTISHPYTVAFQTEQLNIIAGEKVLEIGTGCGYQTAVLSEMGAKVFSIERQKVLFQKTKIKGKKSQKKNFKSFLGPGIITPKFFIFLCFLKLF